MRMKFSNVMATVAMTAAVALGGTNKDAELYIDCAPATPIIDSMGTCVTDSVFTVGICVHKAVKVFSYQYSVVFDTSRLLFVKAAKGGADCPNLLESKGQSMSFKGSRELSDSTRVLMAGWLSGDDTSQCAGGDGCLGLLTFRKRTGDTAILSLAKILVLDCSLSEDTCQSHSARVAAGSLGVCDGRVIAAAREKVEFIQGRVRIAAPAGEAIGRAAISDISGREIRRFSAGPSMMEADLKGAARGMYVVTIMRGNRISSYPFVIGR
jgi:hypothetical protein